MPRIAMLSIFCLGLLATGAAHADADDYRGWIGYRSPYFVPPPPPPPPPVVVVPSWPVSPPINYAREYPPARYYAPPYGVVRYPPRYYVRPWHRWHRDWHRWDDDDDD